MGKTIVITGASDGIGAAAARRLHRDGHTVVLVGRSAEKTATIADSIGAHWFTADFGDLAQVRSLAAVLADAYPRIDVLANNAGGIMSERAETIDGFERTFQVNHLAPFLLTTDLMPTLIAGRATVIQTASLAARVFSRFDIEDLQNARKYAPQRAYGNAKLANILFTVELQRRFGDAGISAAAFHPGIVGTGFANDTTHVMRWLYHGPLQRLFTVSPERGADQLVWLAEGVPGRTFAPGAYYESRAIPNRVSPEVHDPWIARELWERSAELLRGAL